MASLITVLSGCNGGGGGTMPVWSFTFSDAAWSWPPARTAAQSSPASRGRLNLAGLFDILFHPQPAYAAASGATFAVTINQGNNFSGNYSIAGPSGCSVTVNVWGGFSPGLDGFIFNLNGGGSCGWRVYGSGSGRMDLNWPNSTIASGRYTIGLADGPCPLGCSGTFMAHKL